MNPALTSRLSAKKTARPHAAVYPTRVFASMAAPKRAGVSASLAKPIRNPANAAAPGRLRMAKIMSPSIRKSGATRGLPRRGRT